jgi:hypothetical protein
MSHLLRRCSGCAPSSPMSILDEVGIARGWDTRAGKHNDHMGRIGCPTFG